MDVTLVNLPIRHTDWRVAARWTDTVFNDSGYSYPVKPFEMQGLAEYFATAKNTRPLPGGPRYKALRMDNIRSLNLANKNESSGDRIAVVIDLGDVGGSWGVNTNNLQLDGVNFLAAAPLEVTSYARDGLNDIEIAGATTLENTLRKTWFDTYGSQGAQDTDLLGPVAFSFRV
ncbi:hypothetical protein ABOM_002066 [Aspergillus bombycis]|uniref:Uncharacterized protein n=1 Tax=Aspergillus bombycis TaxID=109264 RepID=A0A1F8AA77_9EURO|nr:hypothetical protein ABOM_002066 [Aspergillus bombycis]OGM48633.1 hypothetical protein ABOM_002066 [Aspergillus bombycis]